MYAAEITRLTQEAFPGYNDAAIQMKRFEAGLYPVLQAYTPRTWAVTLKQAFVIAGREHRRKCI